MRRIVAFESVTLDGVMQAPGRLDEDTRGGFSHGGWAVPYADEVVAGMAGEGATSRDAILLGRRTYEDFYGFWPKQGDDNPFTKILEETTKYVSHGRFASRFLGRTRRCFLAPRPSPA